MRFMSTKMLADTQRKLLNLKLFTNNHLFWGKPNYLKCPGYQTKWYPIEKVNTQLNKKNLGIYPIDLKAYMYLFHCDCQGLNRKL